MLNIKKLAKTHKNNFFFVNHNIKLFIIENVEKLKLKTNRTKLFTLNKSQYTHARLKNIMYHINALRIFNSILHIPNTAPPTPYKYYLSYKSCTLSHVAVEYTHRSYYSAPPLHRTLSKHSLWPAAA